MTVIEWKALINETLNEGWATREGDLTKLSFDLHGHDGWDIVASRVGGPLVDTLTPTSADEAPKKSLSAKYGLGEQPLHTDGAHQQERPGIILLSAAQPSKIPTLLWRMRSFRDLPDGIYADLHHGLFNVDSGKGSFLAPALDRHGFRFDPGCMEPADQRAKRVAGYFASVQKDAEHYEWRESGQILAINNQGVLHARADTDDDLNRAMHRVTLKQGKA